MIEIFAFESRTGSGATIASCNLNLQFKFVIEMQILYFFSIEKFFFTFFSNIE